MGTKNNPGAFDCYAAAEPDEPMFVLLGRDKHAPTLIWLWAALRELDGEDPAKVHEARECVAQMLEYAHGRGRPAVGLAQATLVGVMEMVRTINGLVKVQDTKNSATDTEVLRRFLAETRME